MTVAVVAGASGFVGLALVRRLRDEGAHIRLVGRTGPNARWGDADALRAAVDGADVVINLAGKSVNCRYTPANRAEILRSRVETTRALGDAIATAADPPTLWINASTATIYRHADDRPMTESAGEIGSGFSVDVATAWERAFFDRELPATRRVALRMAIVLGPGSVLPPLVRLVRVGLGGAQLDGRWPATRARLAAGTVHRFGTPDGRQRFSWVHLEDVLRAVRFVRDRDDIEGVLNVSAPNPSDNRTVMGTLRSLLHGAPGLPAFRWMLEVGAAVLRTETELVLKSRWVVPERLTALGFEFAYPDLEPALRQILDRP